MITEGFSQACFLDTHVFLYLRGLTCIQCFISAFYHCLHVPSTNTHSDGLNSVVSDVMGFPSAQTEKAITGGTVRYLYLLVSTVEAILLRMLHVCKMYSGVVHDGTEQTLWLTV